MARNELLLLTAHMTKCHSITNLLFFFFFLRVRLSYVLGLLLRPLWCYFCACPGRGTHGWWELVPGKDRFAYDHHSMWEGKSAPRPVSNWRCCSCAHLTCGQMIMTVGLPGARAHLCPLGHLGWLLLAPPFFHHKYFCWTSVPWTFPPFHGSLLTLLML